jgi:hypothetical protein
MVKINRQSSLMIASQILPAEISADLRLENPFADEI